MDDIITNIIGYTAGFCAVIITLPQIYKIITTKKAKDISIWSIILLLVTSLLYTIYGILIDSMPLIIMDAISFVLEGILLGLKIYFDCKTQELCSV